MPKDQRHRVVADSLPIDDPANLVSVRSQRQINWMAKVSLLVALSPWRFSRW
jgi:hypothetical protein